MGVNKIDVKLVKRAHGHIGVAHPFFDNFKETITSII